MAVTLQLETRQRQVMAARLQEAVRLLQLSSLDFSQELQQALAINPFLELADEAIPVEGATLDAVMHLPGEINHSEDQIEQSNAAGVSPAIEQQVENTSEKAEVLERTELLPIEDDEESGYFAEAEHPHNKRDTQEVDTLALVQEKESLQVHLRNQLYLLHLSPRQQLIATFIVDALDDDGYLRISEEILHMDLTAICVSEKISPKLTTNEIEHAVQTVQSLDPAGIAARTVEECLRLQLQNLPISSTQQLALKIVESHFAALVKRDMNGLMRALSSPIEEIESACACIRHLDPHPGWRFSHQVSVWVVPDIIVRSVGGVWVATLNPQALPNVQLNKVYAELFRQHAGKSHHGMAGYLQEARWILRNIQQRFNTILRVAEIIVAQQQRFFMHGPLAMRPLVLKDVANVLGLHESTVSRASTHKYMATPAGLFELKYFFSRGLSTQGGVRCSTTAIRTAIKEMIQAEQKDAPLSDVQITRALTEGGLQVARRTVTKYRQMMRIPAAEKRYLRKVES